jgi:hypothetical protein
VVLGSFDLSFYYKHEDSSIAIIGIYTDDLIAAATSTRMVDLLTSLKTFKIKNVWVLRKFLGMRVQFHDDGFILDQETLLLGPIEW